MKFFLKITFQSLIFDLVESRLLKIPFLIKLFEWNTINSKYQEIIYTICNAIPFQISGNHLHYLHCHTIPNIRKSSTLFAMPYHSKYQEIIYTICTAIPFQISGNHLHYLQCHTIPSIRKSSTLFATPSHSKYQEIIHTICNAIPFQISRNHLHYLQRHTIPNTIPNIRKSSTDMHLGLC